MATILDTFVNEFKFDTDTSGLKKAGKAVSQVDREVKGLGETLESLKTIAIGAFAGFFSFQLLSKSLSAFEDESRVMAILGQEVKNAGSAFGASAKELSTFADALEASIGIDDIQIKQSIALLIGFGIKSKDVLEEATRVIINTSEAMGRSATQISRSIGEALADPKEGAQLLKRSFTQLSDSTIQQINVALQANKVSKAQKLIVDGLQKAYGGLATAIGKTAAGQMRIFRSQLSNLSKTLGDVIFIALDPFVKVITKAAKFLNGEGKKSFKEFIEIAGILTGVVLGLAFAVGALDTVMGILLSPFVLIGAAIVGVSLALQDLITFVQGGDSAFGKLLVKLGLTKKQIEDVRKVVSFLGKAFKFLAELAGNTIISIFKAIILLVKQGFEGIKEFIKGIEDAIDFVEKLASKVDRFFKRAGRNQQILKNLNEANPVTAQITRSFTSLAAPLLQPAGATTNRTMTQHNTVSVNVTSNKADPTAVGNEVAKQLGQANRNLALNFDSTVRL